MKPPIGICDSGSGGLTILAACAKALPEQSFVYLGDHANAPYGNRSEDEILRFTTAMVEALFGWGVRLVVLACNTASAVALRRIQEEWLPRHAPKRRVLGVQVPMVEALTGLRWDRENPGRSRLPGRTVAVFATQRTVATGAYPRQVRLRAPDFRMVQQACPGLVAAIEEGRPERELDAMIAGFCRELLEKMKGTQPDAVFLGCTHYPLVEHLFARHLPKSAELLSQPGIVAASLKKYLARHPEFSSNGGQRLEFLTTGDPEHLHHLSQFMPGPKLAFKRL